MKSNVKKIWKSVLLIAAAGVLAACQTPTAGVDSAKKKETPAQTANQTETAAASTPEKVEPEVGNVIRKKGNVTNKGVYIKILVNKTPITNLDLKRRAKLLGLQRVKGNRTKLAENDMIEQALKLEEAKRVKTLASDSEVNQAFANFAKGNRTSSANMARQLNQFGVGANHFKEFMRGQISWRRTVQARFQSETQNLSESDAVSRARQSGAGQVSVQEYNFKQIVFVIPANKRSAARLKTRRSEALAFKASYSNCNGALAMVKKLKDVSIVNRNRVLEPQLPRGWVENVKAADANGMTNPIETERGIELLAICSTKSVSDDKATQIVTQSKEFENFGERGAELSKKYLNELRSRSTIIYQ